MSDAEFRFTYKPKDDSNDLDAYDASQALYGISRSISIITHYTLHRKIIKNATALKGAKVLVRPPARGSFEFIVPIVQVVTDPQNLTAISQGFASSFLYDLTKNVYHRLAGRSEKTSSSQVQQLARHASGDLDALADSIAEDVVRIQRPLVNDNARNFHVTVNGGHVNIINFDYSTYQYAKTKILGDSEVELFGHVRSFNGSTIQGRFWVEEEERTIGFSVNKTTRISSSVRGILSWNLDQWVSKLEGYVHIRGYPLSSKIGLLKHIFITGVERA